MPAPALTTLTPFLGPALIAWIAYRRIRRNFGMQPWRPVAMSIRLGLLLLIATVLSIAAFATPHLGLAIAASLAVGLGLGVFGLSRTHIECKDGARWYTPNPWIGGVLSVLLLGRLAWRWSQGGLLAQQQQASPLTFAIAGLLIGYSLAYTGGLIWRMRQVGAQQPSTAT